jgi:hypothetical protein
MPESRIYAIPFSQANTESAFQKALVHHTRQFYQFFHLYIWPLIASSLILSFCVEFGFLSKKAKTTFILWRDNNNWPRQTTKKII